MASTNGDEVVTDAVQAKAKKATVLKAATEAALRLKFMLLFAVVCLGVLIYLYQPQAAVILSRSGKVIWSILLGYGADREIFHYARPHQFLKPVEGETPLQADARVRCFYMSSIRRVIIIAAVVIGFSQIT